MDAQYQALLGLGILVLLVTWLPLLLRHLPLSLPIVCVALGFVLQQLGVFGDAVQRLSTSRVPEVGAQLVVLIALMGAGLKIDRPFGWRSWATTWRLLGIGMPLMIVTTTLLAAQWAGFGWSAALLIAALLAPIDPVLASDVEVGPPGTGEEGEVRFGLTAEAGLNDGLAFPFVQLAIALAGGTLIDMRWLGFHFLLKIVLAVGCGWLLGKLFGMLVFRLPRLRISNTGDGLAVLGITLLSFVLTETAGGYGFVAVFITALTVRATKWHSDFNRAMTDFASQIERLLAMMLLVLFGAALATGTLDALTLRDAVFGLVLLLIVRPITAWIGLLRSPHPMISRATTAFFGIRGIGTLFYLLYALNRAEFAQSQRIVALVTFVVLCSILLHGLTSTPVMEHLDRIHASMERDARGPRDTGT